MKIGIGIVLTLLTVSLVPLTVRAEDEAPARPGTVNYIEGQASINNQMLDEKSIRATELQTGQSLHTEAGKAEILLTPGVFLRIGEMSSVTMVSPGLTHTEVKLDQGHAIIEVDEIHSENRLEIKDGGATTLLSKTGLYEFDADRHTLGVFTGVAFVEEGYRQFKVKGGREVLLDGGEPTKTFKLDKKTAEEDDLYHWASLRSSYVAEANTDAAHTYVVGGPSWFGEGWYWDPWFGAYTFLPGDGIFYSPFGWGFYSPGFAYAAPYFYGGGYYRHFGPNYHAWGPGGHYGPPIRGGGGGVLYGARPELGGGHGFGGFGGGGFGGGGFGGGGFGGGGFHGGGMHR